MTPCPACQSDNVYAFQESVPFTGEHVSFLPGLGTIFTAAYVKPVPCADYGLARFFADDDARERMKRNSGWKKL